MSQVLQPSAEWMPAYAALEDKKQWEGLAQALLAALATFLLQSRQACAVFESSCGRLGGLIKMMIIDLSILSK